MKFKRAGFLTKIVILALLIYMATSLLNLRGEIQDVRQEKGALAQQVSSQEIRNQQLQDAIDHSDDPEVQKKVYEDKGYVPVDADVYIDVAN